MRWILRLLVLPFALLLIGSLRFLEALSNGLYEAVDYWGKKFRK